MNNKKPTSPVRSAGVPRRQYRSFVPSFPNGDSLVALLSITFRIVLYQLITSTIEARDLIHQVIVSLFQSPITEFVIYLSVC